LIAAIKIYENLFKGQVLQILIDFHRG